MCDILYYEEKVSHKQITSETVEFVKIGVYLQQHSKLCGIRTVNWRYYA
jgi:hypothetical protein